MSATEAGSASNESFHGLARLVSPADLGVAFQPIVALSSGEFFASEALARCVAPGLQYPPTLFGNAAEMGCVGALGRAIRELAVAAAPGIPLFLNIHPLELQDAWLVRPDDPIYTHDGEVYLEVTESVPFSHYQLCLDVLNDVRSRSGAYVVVDDLGAGYSNLKRISDLAPKLVKLDRDLIQGVATNDRLARLISSVARLCRDMGAQVVAEGIETEAERLTLEQCEIEYGQGYLFGRPAFPFVYPSRIRARNGRRALGQGGSEQ
jgi:EAL domain-containing protein (putative c-di-GMP-specific phosphodiesterase class I)